MFNTGLERTSALTKLFFIKTAEWRRNVVQERGYDRDTGVQSGVNQGVWIIKRPSEGGGGLASVD